MDIASDHRACSRHAGVELAPLAFGGETMRWMGVYLIGYILLVAALLLALWKTGLLASIGAFWIGVGLLFLIGIGIIFAVANSGRKENITVDRG